VAKNKDTMTSNRTGILDVEELTVTKVDEKNGGETVYDIREMLTRFNGHNVSLTVTVDTEAPSVEE
jgi:hypothetical protein